MCPEAVFRNVEILYEQFTLNESAVGVNETGFAFPDRFNLGACQLNTCHEFFQEKVLEVGLLVFYRYGFGEIAHASWVKKIAKIGKKVVWWYGGKVVRWYGGKVVRGN
jgi:hypothetical protein